MVHKVKVVMFGNKFLSNVLLRMLLVFKNKIMLNQIPPVSTTEGDPVWVVQLPPPPPCIRIGGMKDNFIFDTSLPFFGWK